MDKNCKKIVVYPKLSTNVTKIACMLATFSISVVGWCVQSFSCSTQLQCRGWFVLCCPWGCDNYFKTSLRQAIWCVSTQAMCIYPSYVSTQAMQGGDYAQYQNTCQNIIDQISLETQWSLPQEVITMGEKYMTHLNSFSFNCRNRF